MTSDTREPRAVSGKGYFAHPAGICETDRVGADTRIWAFAHVLPGAQIGRECNICDHVFIENEVTLGDRVTVKCGVAIWDGVRIEDDVFVGPCVTFTNDVFPRSKVDRPKIADTVVRRGASLGANCTLLPGVTIGVQAMVGAGSVVTHDVPDHALVYGQPARIHGWVCFCARRLELRGASGWCATCQRSVPLPQEAAASSTV